MRTLIFLAALLLAPAADAETLDDLRWLKGCWRTQGGASVITEVWSTPPMPAMLGYSFTTRDGQIRDWEQTRIEIIDGTPTFIAMPRGGAPVRFRLTSTVFESDTRLHGDSATFENPEHDYPQRVTYARVGDRLTATISRTDGSDVGTFRYRRISCNASLRP
jgi:hypothetical protein